MTRASEPDWTRIGRWCNAERRSIWARVNQRLGEPPHSLEICAGREGDDFYKHILSDDPCWPWLHELVSRAIWFARTNEEGGP